MKEKWEYEIIEVKENFADCDYWYGGTDFFIDDHDIELLKQGKILNFSINMEYGCTLSYKK